jgi:hypothetical protein
MRTQQDEMQRAMIENSDIPENLVLEIYGLKPAYTDKLDDPSVNQYLNDSLPMQKSVDVLLRADGGVTKHALS